MRVKDMNRRQQKAVFAKMGTITAKTSIHKSKTSNEKILRKDLKGKDKPANEGKIRKDFPNLPHIRFGTDKKYLKTQKEKEIYTLGWARAKQGHYPE